MPGGHSGRAEGGGWGGGVGYSGPESSGTQALPGTYSEASAPGAQSHSWLSLTAELRCFQSFLSKSPLCSEQAPVTQNPAPQIWKTHVCKAHRTYSEE